MAGSNGPLSRSGREWREEGKGRQAAATGRRGVGKVRGDGAGSCGGSAGGGERRGRWCGEAPRGCGATRQSCGGGARGGERRGRRCGEAGCGRGQKHALGPRWPWAGPAQAWAGDGGGGWGRVAACHWSGAAALAASGGGATIGGSPSGGGAEGQRGS
nr:loricrin-like [Aegilops tauschii subsp. strangulata]